MDIFQDIAVKLNLECPYILTSPLDKTYKTFGAQTGRETLNNLENIIKNLKTKYFDKFKSVNLITMAQHQLEK